MFLLFYTEPFHGKTWNTSLLRRDPYARSQNTLSESIRICRENLDLIIQSCGHLDVPLGLNIESLTNRKEEIDASINLYRLLKATMELNLAEKQIA